MDIKVIFAMVILIGMYGHLNGAIPTLPPSPSSPIVCMMGKCSPSVCNNGTDYRPVQCITYLNSCVTEVTLLKTGVKQYDFRCATKTCDLEKKGANVTTDVLCCNTSQCNTYVVAKAYTKPSTVTTPTTTPKTTPVATPKTTPVASPLTTPVASPLTTPAASPNSTQANSKNNSGTSRWHNNNVLFGVLAWLLIVIH